jgi:predicted DNA-binding transcriptional regulator YafY
MLRLKVEDLARDFPDNDSCLEWLKNQLYPKGIKCPICKIVTKHHKASKIPCYVCDNCGHHVYPAAGTIFNKSSLSLKTWFKVIYKIYTTGCRISARKIQREYGMTYKTAWRMVRKIKELLKENSTTFNSEDASEKTEINILNSANNQSLNVNGDIANNISDIPNKPEQQSMDQSLSTLSLLIEDNQKGHQSKRDRTARLLKLQILLWQQTGGLTIEEIARKCSISKRTAYRDLKTIESELNIPIWEENNKRGIVEGYFLPPIKFNQEEAFNIYIASRLLQKEFHIYNPTIASIFMKIGAIVPPYLRKQIQDSIKYIEQRPVNQTQIRNLYTLAKAWTSQHQVKICYPENLGSEPTELIIEPYFMDPSLSLHTINVIAFCPLRKTMGVFHINNILGNVIICPDTYKIPENFNSIDSANSTWGWPMDGNVATVKLRFTPRVRQLVMSTIWHPSQMTETKNDGSLIITFKVCKNNSFRSWVLSWNREVKVLEPKEFREDLARFAQGLAQVYF